MLDQRRRHCAKREPTWGQRIVLAGWVASMRL